MRGSAAPDVRHVREKPTGIGITGSLYLILAIWPAECMSPAQSDAKELSVQITPRQNRGWRKTRFPPPKMLCTGARHGRRPRNHRFQTVTPPPVNGQQAAANPDAAAAVSRLECSR